VNGEEMLDKPGIRAAGYGVVKAAGEYPSNSASSKKVQKLDHKVLTLS